MAPANGFGVVQRQLELQDDNVTYSTDATLATHVRNSAVTIKLAGFKAISRGMSSSVHPAALITGLLRTAVVHHDDTKCFPSQAGCTGPRVAASFVLREDVTFSVNFPKATFTVFVNPDDSTGVDAISKVFTCSQAICHVSVPLPEDAFLAKLPAGKQNFTVTYRLGDDGELKTLPGEVTWVPPPETIADDVVDTAYAVVPSRYLFPSDLFVVTVRSRFKKYFKTAQVRVSVGEELTIVSTQAPTTAFENSLIDASKQQAVVSLAGRKDGKGSGEQSDITDEVLLQLTLRVNSDVEAGATSTIEIDKLTELTDLNENGLYPNQVGKIETRAGIVTDAPAIVHFARDTPVGVFATVSSTLPTELINTATVSRVAITVPITVTAVSIRGATSAAEDTKCTSPEPKTLQAGGDDGCTATLDGTETVGARKFDFKVESVEGASTIPFRVHQLVTDSAKVTLENDLLRPYAGLYDESDENCETLQYQSCGIVTTASFADRSGYVFVDLDVSAIANVVSDNSNVAKIGSSAATSMIVTGVAEGTATLQLKDASDAVISEVVAKVADQSVENMLAVVGLDVAVANRLGSVAGGGLGPYDRNSSVDISIGSLVQTKLSYEKDSMTVLVFAVFEDDSRLQLSEGTGLVLQSYNELALTVVKNKVVVPFDPVKAEGELLGVAWEPQGDCQKSSHSMSEYMQRNVTLQVEPPVAESMAASAANNYVVCTDDIATHSGADFHTTTQLSVSLTFTDGRTVNNLAADSRTNYAVSDTSLFTIDENGGVTANGDGKIGTAKVNVTFAGQSVYKLVSIVVAKLESITMSAIPHPAYSGSGSVDVDTLSKITCTELYEQAKLYFVATLTNSVTKVISGSKLDITTDGNVGMEVSDDNNRILTVGADGIETIAAHFGENGNQMAANSLNVSADSVDAVTVKAINNLRLVASGSKVSTLAGFKGSKKAQMQFGITLSNDRQYVNVFDSNGIAELPGMFEFASEQSAAISIDDAKGTATLLDNHYEAIKLSATTSVDLCGNAAPVVTKSLEIFANLDPVGADIDVGARTGAPVPAQKKGAEFSVDVRVNTNSKRLQAYNVLVAYSTDDLELVETFTDVESTFKSGVSSGNNDLEDACSGAGLGTNCAVAVAAQVAASAGGLKGTGEIFTVTFKVKEGGSVAAVTELSGVIVQLLDTSPGGGETIGTKNAVFEAGAVYVKITDGGRRRRARRDVVTPHMISRGRRASGLPLEKGDANCDDEFDLKDAAFLFDYATARVGDFTSDLGKIVTTKLKQCRDNNGLEASDVSFLDPDGDTWPSPVDFTYMLDILAGNFYFTKLSLPVDDSCDAHFSVQMTNAQGNAASDGARVFLDFAMVDNADLFAAMEDSDGFVSNDKGDALSGGLVEATASEDDPTLFEVNLGTNVAMVGVGISVIQISSKKGWRFFDGLASVDAPSFDGFEYQSNLVYAKSLLGTTFDFQWKPGYNPLKFVESRCTTTTTTTESSTTTTSVTLSSTSTTTTTTTTHTFTVTTTTTTSSASSTTISSTTVSTTTTTRLVPTDVVIYYKVDCVDGETDFGTITADTIKEIDEKIDTGLWQGEPYGACGSIVVTVTAVSEPAAERIRTHIFDRNNTGGINVVIDGETYPGLLTNPPTTTRTTTSKTSTTTTKTSTTKTSTTRTTSTSTVTVTTSTVTSTTLSTTTVTSTTVTFTNTTTTRTDTTTTRTTTSVTTATTATTTTTTITTTYVPGKCNGVTEPAGCGTSMSKPECLSDKTVRQKCPIMCGIACTSTSTTITNTVTTITSTFTTVSSTTLTATTITTTTTFTSTTRTTSTRTSTTLSTTTLSTTTTLTTATSSTTTYTSTTRTTTSMTVTTQTTTTTSITQTSTTKTSTTITKTTVTSTTVTETSTTSTTTTTTVTSSTVTETSTSRTSTTTTYAPGSCDGNDEAAGCGTTIPKENCRDKGEVGRNAKQECFVMCGTDPVLAFRSIGTGGFCLKDITRVVLQDQKLACVQ
jgi:hypothetical protein